MLHSYQKENSSGSKTSVLLDSLYKYANKYPEDRTTDRLLDRIKRPLQYIANRDIAKLNLEGRPDQESMIDVINWKNNYLLAVFIHIYRNKDRFDNYRADKDIEIGKKVVLIHEIPLGLPSFYIPREQQYMLVEDAISHGLPLIRHHALLISKFDLRELQRVYQIYRMFQDNLWNSGLAEEIMDKLFIELIYRNKRFLSLDYYDLFDRIKSLGERMLIAEHVLETFREFLAKT